jgi:sulfur carrier protein
MGLFIRAKIGPPRDRLLHKEYSGGPTPRSSVAICLISRERFTRWVPVDGPRCGVYIRLVPDIVVNGERRTVPAGATVAALLQTLALSSEHVAAERNREIVPRAAHAETGLNEGDTLEIVTFVGGG